MAEKVASKAAAETMTAFQKKALNVLEGGGALKDAVGLTAADVETVHSIGVTFVEQGKYEQAEPMFQFACLHAHTTPRYWASLGNCRQMMRNYVGAVAAFDYGLMLDENDPWAPIHIAVCCLALGNKDGAARALTAAEQAVASGKPDEAVRQRIVALRQAL
jgi:type III secretion system low calcium response chaperone LcrH/SycD